MKVDLEGYLGMLTGKEVRLVPYVVRGPLYLKRFSLKTANLFGRDIVFAFVENDSLTPGEYRDYGAMLFEKTSRSVVFVFKAMSTSRRNAFLRSGVGFIVPMNQMFIPVFIDVKEWMPKVREVRDCLGNMAQVLALREIVKEDVAGVPFCELAAQLGCSATMITNAVDDLVQHALAEVVGGRPKTLKFKARGSDLWTLAKNLMRSPVRRTFLNRKCPSGVPSAGLTALAERSMLSAPSIPVLAVTRERLKDADVFVCADSRDEAGSIVEVWSYDPCVIGTDGVDRYSLYLSLKEVSDPRVQGELNDLMEAGNE